MATYTTNYGWTKPSYEDEADIEVINGTFDSIDEQVKTVETALDSKQNTLTTTQLAAVTSGIDSEKVEQIETNKNNISSCQAFTNNATIDSDRKLYITGTEPTGDIPIGSTWINGNTIKAATRTNNIFNIYTATENALLTETSPGDLVASEYYNTSDYIELSDSAITVSLVSSLNQNRIIRINAYDVNLEFLGVYNSSPFSTGAKTYTVNLSNAAKYVRFSYIATDSDIMVNTGSTAEQFQPYWLWQ